MATPPTTTDSARVWANFQLNQIEQALDADGLALVSPVMFGVEHRVKIAVEARANRRDTLAVILDTSGGTVNTVERIVRVFRHHYDTVKFIIPNQAMSAGTLLVMSGDDIMMDYHSCLGPIDLQVEREDGSPVPALSYLSQYTELSEKAELSAADYVLVDKLDLAFLERIRLASRLSKRLLKRWLIEYKFRNWKKTETKGDVVTKEKKEELADFIADRLSDHKHWMTHERGIDIRILQDELKLRITNLEEHPELRRMVWDYFWFLVDYMSKNKLVSFVHTPDHF